MTDLLPAFREQLVRRPPPAGRGLVAVSGGVDSVALLDLLARSTDSHPLQLVVAHVDHGIHQGSAEVAARVATLADQYGLPCESVRINLGAGASETRAREARYAALRRILHGLRGGLLCLGHHRDDQTETILLRVLEGSGAAGLAAMRERQGDRYRPLLGFSRAQLAAHAAVRGLAAWEDPANTDPAHRRSWLRHDVIPLLEQRVPQLQVNLLRLAAGAAHQREAWDALLPRLDLVCADPADGAHSVAAAPLRDYDSPVVRELVMALCRRAGCTIGVRRAARVEELLRTGESGSRTDLGAGWVAEIAFDRLRIRSSALQPSAPGRIEGVEGRFAWGGFTVRWQVSRAPERLARTGQRTWVAVGGLAIRAWQPGDRIRPLRGRGSRLVVRCMQDRRVPRSCRAGWPVLALGDELLWVPGVCRADIEVPEPGTEALQLDVSRD